MTALFVALSVATFAVVAVAGVVWLGGIVYYLVQAGYDVVRKPKRSRGASRSG